jgi:hypothetical protein
MVPSSNVSRELRGFAKLNSLDKARTVTGISQSAKSFQASKGGVQNRLGAGSPSARLAEVAARE